MGRFRCERYRVSAKEDLERGLSLFELKLTRFSFVSVTGS